MSSPNPDATSYGQINYTISETAQRPAGHACLVDASLEAFKNLCEWFVVATTSDGQRRICTKKNFQRVLLVDILAGLLRAEDELQVHSKRKDGRWVESFPSLRGFALQHRKLRVAYEPVWTHAATGARWGVVAGVSVAILNALIFYSMTDPWVAVCLGASALVAFVPRFGSRIAPFVFGSLGLMGKVAPAFGILTAIIIFAILGGLPGMTIGGAIGWVREEKLPRAPDAPAEGGFVAVKALVLPLVGWLLAWSVFALVVYPWAARIVGSSSPGLLPK
jgi:hypothetical protein